MPVFTKANTAVLYIHIPKTGGTSIEALFKASGWQVHYVEYADQQQLNHLRWCSPQHMHAERLEAEFDLKQFNFIFATVRHPFARFRSEYSMANFLTGIPSSTHVENWANTTIDAYQKNPYLLDNHIRPQAGFIVDNCQIYKLEDGLADIRHALETQLNEPLKNETFHELHHKQFSGYDSADVPLNETTKARLKDFYQEDFRTLGYSDD